MTFDELFKKLTKEALEEYFSEKPFVPNSLDVIKKTSESRPFIPEIWLVELTDFLDDYVLSQHVRIYNSLYRIMVLDKKKSFKSKDPVYIYVYELIQLRELEILKEPNIGKKSLWHIKNALSKNNLSLGTHITDVEIAEIERLLKLKTH